jgi:hypothetical protein
MTVVTHGLVELFQCGQLLRAVSGLAQQGGPALWLLACPHHALTATVGIGSSFFLLPSSVGSSTFL